MPSTASTSALASRGSTHGPRVRTPVWRSAGRGLARLCRSGPAARVLDRSPV